MKEFNIGDKVWWAKYQRERTQETCPVCFGTCFVKVILGDKSQVKTHCDFCKRGFSGSLGVIGTYEYIPAVEQITITGKEVRENQEKKRIEYFFTNYTVRAGEDIFETKEEAEKALVYKIEAAEKEDVERLHINKDGHFKKYSWHVGYYMREKKKALEQIELYDRQITHFKAKVKGGNK
jgi:hypothetical protein